MTIRPCRAADREAIFAIVNAAAEAYRDVIPADRWHEPYMPMSELEEELAAGVEFWGYEDDGELVGVMGIQDVGDVDLIRHAYVLPGLQGRGIGQRAAGAAHRRTRRGLFWSEPGRPPSGRSASTSGTASSRSAASARPSCCAPTGTSRSARSRPRSCWRSRRSAEIRQTTGGGEPSALAKQRRVPVAHDAGVVERRAEELERRGMRVGARARVLPVEHEQAHLRLPAGGFGRQLALVEALGRRVGIRIEGGARVARIAGPPSDGHLLRVHRVAHDEVVRRRVGGVAGEEAHGQVEAAPPGVDRRSSGRGRAPGTRSGRAQRGSRRRNNARRPPRHRSRARGPRRAATVQGTSCGVGSISTGPARPLIAWSSSRVTSPTGRSGVSATRAERPSLCSATASWLWRSRAATSAPEPSGAGNGLRLPAARGEPERRVLKLGLGRREGHRQLPEHLRVRMQRVAGLAPGVVVESRPLVAHGLTLAIALRFV